MCVCVLVFKHTYMFKYFCKIVQMFLLKYGESYVTSLFLNIIF